MMQYWQQEWDKWRDSIDSTREEWNRIQHIPLEQFVVNPKDQDRLGIDLSGLHNDHRGEKKDRAVICKAFESFAKTSYGRKSLSKFAKKGQAIAGYTYTQNGRYYNNGINLLFYYPLIQSPSTADAVTDHETTNNQLKITILFGEPPSSEDNIAKVLVTICHEVFFHAFLFAEDFIDDKIINSSNINQYLKKRYSTHNERQEYQDLLFKHRFRDFGIPILMEYFGNRKSKSEVIQFMTDNGGCNITNYGTRWSK
jgi:hypothetical protein